VISRQQPKTFAEWLERLAAAVESLAEIRKITRGNVEVRRLRQHSLDGPQIAVDIAEDENSHRDLGIDSRTTRPAK